MDQLKERVKFINYKGSKILSIDASSLSSDGIIVILDISKALIRAEPLKSALVFGDWTNMNVELKLIDAFKEYMTNNKPHIKYTAIIGVQDFMRGTIEFILKALKRDNIKFFKTREEALDFLAAQR
ncbi:MAG: hypothetical protein HQK49_06300 [Oligoflexia bacterium]|nr:hypothetical protein [Oligoflexia bacterium]